MRLIGFNFSKISAEKFKGKKGEKLKINTDMDIEDISKMEENLLKGKEEVIKVDFSYIINYNPNFAKIELKGTMLFSIDPKESKQLLKEWKKKKMPEDFRIGAFNIILKKASLKALEMEDELNLPYHVPMPSFKRQSK